MILFFKELINWKASLCTDAGSGLFCMIRPENLCKNATFPFAMTTNTLAQYSPSRQDAKLCQARWWCSIQARKLDQKLRFISFVVSYCRVIYWVVRLSPWRSRWCSRALHAILVGTRYSTMKGQALKGCCKNMKADGGLMMWRHRDHKDHPWHNHSYIRQVRIVQEKAHVDIPKYISLWSQTLAPWSAWVGAEFELLAGGGPIHQWSFYKLEHLINWYRELSQGQ